MGYENWLHYKRLHPSQLSKLKTGGLIENSPAGDGASWALRLTEKGRLLVLGGRDPEERWCRSWDGEWRLLMFDIPQGNDRTRSKLYQWLRCNHFGCLQKSVWISPDPLDELDDLLADVQTSSAKMAVMDARPRFRGAERDVDIAALAWKFDEINRRYQAYMDLAGEGIPMKARPAAARTWVGQEHALWTRAVGYDPLLPDELLPHGYLGKKAWQARRRLLKKAAPMAVALEEE
jgi:phenylacetic acid degradation operon negative regulatory protein